MIHNVDPQLTQWDVGRIVTISDSNATYIHFANQGDSKAVIIEIENGSAKIPDYLLQTGKTVIAYAVKDGVTLESKSFSVRKRERPENYIYEDDQRNYIYDLVADVEDAINRATAVADDLIRAKDNGEFTPEKGVDYWTEADKKEIKDYVDETINKTDSGIINEASGNPIILKDSSDRKLQGLNLYGKTTQNGKPTPDAPVELVSVGAGGSITVSVTDGDGNTQTLTVPTPNGLPGVPVKTGGNYIDANGQRWICDEIDFVRGVYVKRTNQIILDGSSDEEWWNGHFKAPWGVKIPGIAQGLGDDSQLLCDAYEVATYNASWNNYDYMVTRHGTEPTNITVCFRDIRYLESDKTTWISYIATNPITIRYVLATPIETPLTAEQLEAYANLHTHKPITTITCDADMKVEYVADTKTYIDNKFNELAAAIVNNI